MSKFVIFAGVAFLLVATARAQVTPILSKLVFKDIGGDSIEVLQNYEDLENFKTLLDFLPKAVEWCAIGVWRLYPELNYNNNGDISSGYTFSNEFPDTLDTDVSKCVFKPIEQSEAIEYAKMKSIRHLGPRDINAVRLVLYSDYFWAGNATVISGFAGVPILGPVRSYMITAITDDTAAANMAATTIPLFKVYEHGDFLQEDGMTCMALINGIDGSLAHPSTPAAKIYTVGNVANETPKIFGSVRRLSFGTLANWHASCKSTTDYTINQKSLPPHISL